MTIQAVVTHSPYVVRRRTAGDSYDLIARQETMSQTLLIPGLSRLNPNKLFANGQPGGWADPYDLTRMWIDDAGTTPMTLANLGTGIGRCITKGNAITLVQANAADRPVWGRHPVSGIRNQIAFSEDVSNAAWTFFNVSGSATRVGNDITFGASAIDRILSSTLTIAANTQMTASFTLSGSGQVRLFLIDGTGSTQTPGNITLTSAPTRYTATFTLVNAGSQARCAIYNDSTGAPATFTIHNCQFEFGPIATTYQRVTSRFDITEVGSPSLYYFSGNGVNQRWSSNATVDFTGTDKVTVWAGAQRLSNAARGTIVELTSSIASNNGAFHLAGPNAVSDTFGWESKGTTLRDAVATVALGSPRRLVGVGDISGDLSRLIVDGTATDNTGDQGTGNYSNATLHVFSRGGSSQFFNGRLYSLIIAGGLYDSRTIARFADWTTKPRRLITA